jgi:hypothetical protein
MFTLGVGPKILYTAKFRKCVGNIFNSDRKIERGDAPDALFFSDHNYLDFGLKIKMDSEDMLTVRFLPKGVHGPFRIMTVTFFNKEPKHPRRIGTKYPIVSPEGKLIYDFNGRFAIDSVKNTALTNRLGGRTIGSVRKTGKNLLEIDLRFPHDPLWILGIGMAAFLCKAK